MNVRWTTWRSFAAGLALGACGCGGGAAAAEDVQSADREQDPADPSASEAAPEAVEGSSHAEPPEESKAGCADSTCFACGDGLCPTGFYCDAKVGPACSWLPECAKDPSCECIRRVLGADCACEAREGGPHVECS